MGVEIEVRGLSTSFGRDVIWQDVSLTLPSGEISVMLGPSGTGKSVFLKTLVGLLKPEQGSIVIQGRDLVTLKEQTSTRCASSSASCSRTARSSAR